MGCGASTDNPSSLHAERRLLKAAETGALATLKRLVEEGVNLEATDEGGKTALVLAAWQDNLDCLKHLIAMGANLEARDQKGERALIDAAALGNLECVDYLIAKGANVNAQNRCKDTPLHLAAMNGHAPCAESLLKAGADPSLKNNDGTTALGWAKKNRRTEVIQLLQNGPASQAAASQAAASQGDIFASYKQNDGSDALLMNMYHTLKPLEVWLDKMRGEERSEAGMVAGVKTCRLFCAVISPAYFQSDFCLLEIRTALQQEKKIAVCYNGSKFKVQEALGWIPTEFAALKSEELIKLDEDMEYMVVGLGKLKKRL